MIDVIRAESLTKNYRSVQALRSLNLSVSAGEIYALVGPNGAGKTTAIKILMNIIRPTAGRAEVLGLDSTTLRGRSFTEIGYVSENQDLPGSMRVGELLSYLRGFYGSWDRDLERELVRDFDLPLDRRIRSLSRGMRMKVALASSLAYRPKLIVMDEPFSGLDPLVRDELIRGMLDRAEAASVLISSHDLGEIESFASYIGYIDHGSMLFAEEMNSLIGRFREVEVFLEQPPTSAPTWPNSWLQVQISSAMVRYIESRFNPEGSPNEVRDLLGPVRDVTFRPMSLRDIFVAVARSGNNANREVSA